MNKNILRGFIVIAILALIGFGGVVFWPVNLTKPYTLLVAPQRGLAQVAGQLERDGVIRSARLMALIGRLNGQDRTLKAGIYRFNGSLSIWEVLHRFATGKPDEESITVIEGWTFYQLRQALAQERAIQPLSLNLSDTQILKAIGAPETQAEGLFFPNTYYFTPQSTDIALLRRAYVAMQEHLRTVWSQRDPNTVLNTPYQLLILASLIEKETPLNDERPWIAAVFINRLSVGMKLQSDPTVIYGLGTRYQGHLGLAQLKEDSPYNTYTRKGLPPTPIALPSEASLLAAAHPAKSRALYFVARGDGSSEFSNTLEQHNAAVRQYILKKR